MSSKWVPCSTRTPLCMTMILSAFWMVDRRCAITTLVRPTCALSRASCTTWTQATRNTNWTCDRTVMVVTHSQETCTSRLVQETWPSDMVSCTRFFLYKFLAPNTAQLYYIQETCMHVTRMVSSDWSAAYRCHVFILLCWCCWQFVVQS